MGRPDLYQQSDVDERNRQLRNIAKIFKLARSVIVWLGDETFDSDLALKAIEMGDLTKSESEHEVVAAVKSLLRRSWFRRVWVRQEIGLAQAAIVRCGSSSIPLATMKTALEHTALKSVQIPSMVSVSDEDIHAAMAVSHAGWAREKDYYLLDLLHRGRLSEATDPHDKIYAFLGMANDPFINMLDPDYGKSLPEVFENLAKFLINRDGLLDVIYAAEAQDSEVSKWDPNLLPSWVPDWTVKSGVNRFRWKRDTSNLSGFNTNSYYNASFEVLSGTLSLFQKYRKNNRIVRR